MNLSFRRRSAVCLLAVAVGGFGAHAIAGGSDNDGNDFRHGMVFMSTNAAAGNAVRVYARAASGPATLLTSVASGGDGTGAGLADQGAITLSADGRYLFVVNAGSNSVSTFKVGKKGLVLTSTVASGGTRPISVAESEGIVYVLNAPNGGAGPGNNVVGFRNAKGVLTPLANDTRALDDASQPAEVSFDNDGDVLIVTEKTGGGGFGEIVTYKVHGNGTLDASATVTPSSGQEPYGFAVTDDNVLVVSQPPSSSVSTYTFNEKGEPTPVSADPNVANGQKAACWIAVTPNGNYAFSANAASSTINSFSVGKHGALTLLNAAAGSTSSNGVLDMAVTPDGMQLYAVASKSGQIASFNIGKDGSLSPTGFSDPAPSGAGLAAN